MTWLRRQADQPAPHRCPLPLSGAQLPPGQPVHGAQLGDLWRCDNCRKVWRVGKQCEWCDQNHRYHGPHGGQHPVGLKWRPAGWWTTWRHRNIRTRSETAEAFIREYYNPHLVERAE